MEMLLARDHDSQCTLNRAMKIALDAWSAGSLPADQDSGSEIPSSEALAEYRRLKLKDATVEACVLDRNSRSPICYRSIGGEELDALTST
jgi:hypothetical protein